TACKKNDESNYFCLSDCERLLINGKLIDSSQGSDQPLGAIAYKIFCLDELSGDMWLEVAGKTKVIATGNTNSDGSIIETIKISKEDLNGSKYVFIRFDGVSFQTGTTTSKPVGVVISDY